MNIVLLIAVFLLSTNVVSMPNNDGSQTILYLKFPFGSSKSKNSFSIGLQTTIDEKKVGRKRVMIDSHLSFYDDGYGVYLNNALLSSNRFKHQQNNFLPLIRVLGGASRASRVTKNGKKKKKILE